MDESLTPRAPRRSRGECDRDRILYCSAFRRLAYVTQVTAPEAGHAFHNRLSHSLKVAQVGRRNAERLRALAKAAEIAGNAAATVLSIDPNAVEASCLAHDLGHPPFGHIAETVLREEAEEFIQHDGVFEGNAQSFRIVTRLAQRSGGRGLDLTRQTLDGVLKYPWRCGARIRSARGSASASGATTRTINRRTSSHESTASERTARSRSPSKASRLSSWSGPTT
ncbi:MAG TPA: dNTP triphosphohydrolase [Solirubrobacteraceae bacterium]|nr:dNTP triphosphohydrolase [Solirubrobacteraceae bacterium]